LETSLSYANEYTLRPAFEHRNIPVFFSCDDRYAPVFSVALQSLLENSSTEYNYDVVLLESGLSPGIKTKLLGQAAGRSNVSLRFFNISRLLDIHGADMWWRAPRFTTAAYHRLFLPLCCAGYEKIVYLDCDLIILADIAELFHTDVSDFLLGAVVEYEFKHWEIAGSKNVLLRREYLLNHLQLKYFEGYFNSGVLVMNIRKMREEKTHEKFFAVARINNQFNHDQNVLNVVCEGRVYYLDHGWNILWSIVNPDGWGKTLGRREEYRLACERPKIVHFLGDTSKPWNTPGVYLGAYWWHFAERAPFSKDLSRTNPVQGKPVRIAVRLLGGIGDNLVSLVFLEKLYLACGENIRMDLYGRMGDSQLPPLVCLRSFVDGIYDESLFSAVRGYPVRISIALQVEILHADAAHMTQAPNLLRICKAYKAFAARHKKYLNSEHGPKWDGAWSDYCNLRGWDRFACLGADIVPLSSRTPFALHLDAGAMDALERFSLRERRYVVIHLGASLNIGKAAAHPKTLLKSSMEDLCGLLRKEYPDIAVIQLGSANSTPLENADFCLLEKTTLSETLVLLKHAALLIDGDCGLAHIRHSLTGRSVVLWGSSSAKFLGYRENINLVSPFCSPCLWMTNTWMNGCMRGFKEAECLKRISPERVAEAAGRILDQQPDYAYRLLDAELYTREHRIQYREILRRMLEACGLPHRPVSEHIYGPCRTHIHASKQWEYPYAVRHINSFSAGPLKIADVGGGRGVLAWYLAKQGHEVTVYDINFQWNSGNDPLVEQKFFIFAKTHGFQASFGSVFNIPVPDDSFDVVTCISVVEHVPRKEYALKELLRVLKPGGRLILTYDLVLEKDLHKDSLRVDIFTPESLSVCLAGLDIAAEPHSRKDVETGIREVSEERVGGAPPGLAFGGLVIEKRTIPAFSRKRYPTIVRKPYFLHNIELTNHCPMQCRMCPRHSGMTRPLGFMDMDLFRELVDCYVRDNPLAVNSQRETCLHHFGESLLHPAFDEAFAHARTRGVNVGMSFNPVALNREKAERLFRAGPAWLWAALDGYDDPSLARARGVSGIYEESVANTLFALECWRKYSPQTDFRIMAVDVPAYRDVVEKTVRLWRENHGIEVHRKPFSSWNGSDPAITGLHPNESLAGTPCQKPWDNLSVAWDGTVLACCRDYNNLYALGRFPREPLLDLWNGDRMQALRESVRKGTPAHDLCGLCHYTWHEAGGSSLPISTEIGAHEKGNL
jgi:lipopolysaccharide biosynthesis glycosyltransferase/SAM-dependent methyltransferase